MEVGVAPSGESPQTSWRSQVKLRGKPPSSSCSSSGLLFCQQSGQNLLNSCHITAGTGADKRRRRRTEQMRRKQMRGGGGEQQADSFSSLRYMEMFGWKRRRKMHSCLLYERRPANGRKSACNRKRSEICGVWKRLDARGIWNVRRSRERTEAEVRERLVQTEGLDGRWQVIPEEEEGKWAAN